MLLNKTVVYCNEKPLFVCTLVYLSSVDFHNDCNKESPVGFFRHKTYTHAGMHIHTKHMHTCKTFHLPCLYIFKSGLFHFVLA
jgi:hypothetical protein